MARTQVVFFLGAFIVLAVFAGDTLEPGCKSCDDSISSCLRFMGSAIKGMEPMRQHNESICNLIEITGISSICHNNKSCIKDCGKPGKEGPCYYQMVEIRFHEIRIGCQVHGDPADIAQIVAAESAKLAAGAAGKMMDKMPDMPKVPGFGKRSAEEDTFFVNGSWSDLIVRLEMNLCFDDDIYDLCDVKIMDAEFNGLRLWCEGGEMVAQVCGAITKPELVRYTFGMVVNLFAKKAMGDALKDPSVGDQVTTLNCGDD